MNKCNLMFTTASPSIRSEASKVETGQPRVNVLRSRWESDWGNEPLAIGRQARRRSESLKQSRLDLDVGRVRHQGWC